MKPTLSAAAAALLALAACGGDGGEAANESAANQADAAPGANEAAGGKDPANETAAGDAAPPAAAGEAGPRATASSPSGEIRALLIGRWTDSGDCGDATEFRADGSFTSPVGAGRWTLENEYLTLSGAGPNAEVAVQVIDRQVMETVSPAGRIGRWSRC